MRSSTSHASSAPSSRSTPPKKTQSRRSRSSGNRKQILDVAQLAGGGALEGQQRIVAQHAAAIVHDADQPAAAGFHFHAHFHRAGVEGVFEQLLDYRGGTLHHFSGGDF